jgi:hypothetical protein
MAAGQQRRRRLDAFVKCAGLMLWLHGASCWAQIPPKIDLPPSYTLEILDPTISQKGGVVSVSGSVRMANPWAETAWGYLELSLLDDKGDLITKVPVDYFPKPVPRTYHSDNEPMAVFGVSVNVGDRTVGTVRIVYHD